MAWHCGIHEHRTIYLSGREVLVDVDNDSRIQRIRWKDGAVTTTLVDTVTYRPNGPVATMLYGDGRTQTRTYDLSYRLAGLTDTNGTTPLRQLTYGYEGRDNLTSVSDALVPANTETYGYTPREHLTSANGPYGSLGFTYDGVGNRLTSVKGAVTDSYTYPATSNRLSSITLGAGGSRPFTYDGAGNVITDTRSGTVYGYTYNSAGRLSALSVGGVATATYRYDAMGRQVTRTLVPSGVTIHSVFDSQGRRIAEYNEGTGAIIREYVWMGWEPVAVIEGGVIYLIRADHIGRPSFATTLAGTKVWSAVYLPFGGVHVTTGAPIDARFPGQWFQTEAGLYQNWMRDYDPTTGRYIEADPLGLIDGASVYGYAGGNPGRYVDPRGESPLALVPWVIGLFSGGSGVAAGGASASGVAIGVGILAVGAAGPTGDGTNSGKVIPFPSANLPDQIVGDGCGGGDDCPSEYERLLTLFEVLVEASRESISVSPSGLRNYLNQAERYNKECVPKGYPRLPTSFLR